jgi:drug/metabolite transporter (DMT)-like permease
MINNDLEISMDLSNTAKRHASSTLLTTNGRVVDDIDDFCSRQHNRDDKNNSNNYNINMNNNRSIAILVLLTVPISWGTYTPVVKYMYDKITPSMPGFVFSTGYYIVAAVTLRTILLVVASTTLSSTNNTKLLDNNTNNIEQKIGSDDSNNNDWMITQRGGLELGSYLFIGNGLQVIGLQSIPADRASFLVQLTTVMVPLFSAISAGTIYAIPLRTYVACCIAFMGVVIMGADGSSDDGSNIMMVSNNSSENISAAIQSMHVISQGDILCILAALAYTMHVVRLGRYAPQTNPLELATAKATTEALLGIVLCSCLAYIGSRSSSDLSQLLGLPTFVTQMGSSISEYFSIITTELTMNTGSSLSNDISSSLVISIGAILWTGWVTCAYTIYAQSFGQRIVGPADSNLIYTTQPLFSSLFAYLLLGETLGLYGYVGATLIGISLWLVS